MKLLPYAFLPLLATASVALIGCGADETSSDPQPNAPAQATGPKSTPEQAAAFAEMTGKKQRGQ